ncbi:hypothetical protein B296_00031980 [Ensete ventricosum]|uniref:Uncharacterized protein n=1 Tax=Ensete ventricosum TaxID=4639 RepID=A0A427AEU0_ENSVE|nr:hypothetical protein B296_00031980 [Ensete ventricosum]
MASTETGSKARAPKNARKTNKHIRKRKRNQRRSGTWALLKKTVLLECMRISASPSLMILFDPCEQQNLEILLGWRPSSNPNPPLFQYYRSQACTPLGMTKTGRLRSSISDALGTHEKNPFWGPSPSCPACPPPQSTSKKYLTAIQRLSQSCDSAYSVTVEEQH